MDSFINKIQVNNSNVEYKIKDDMLYDWIGYGIATQLQPIQGFSTGKDGLGYALLAYYVDIALGIKRLNSKDRIVSKRIDSQAMEWLIHTIGDKRLEGIIKEIRTIYDNTQFYLKQAGLEKVTLTRKIKDKGDQYLTPFFQEPVNNKYLLTMDALNSFSDDDSYYGEVELNMEVPREDILYCDKLISNGVSSNHSTESGEWVVINRSADFNVNIPINSVKKNTLSLKSKSDNHYSIQHVSPFTY